MSNNLLKDNNYNDILIFQAVMSAHQFHLHQQMSRQMAVARHSVPELHHRPRHHHLKKLVVVINRVIIIRLVSLVNEKKKKIILVLFILKYNILIGNYKTLQGNTGGPSPMAALMSVADTLTSPEPVPQPPQNPSPTSRSPPTTASNAQQRSVSRGSQHSPNSSGMYFFLFNFIF